MDSLTRLRIVLDEVHMLGRGDCLEIAVVKGLDIAGDQLPGSAVSSHLATSLCQEPAIFSVYGPGRMLAMPRNRSPD